MFARASMLAPQGLAEEEWWVVAGTLYVWRAENQVATFRYGAALGVLELGRAP